MKLRAERVGAWGFAWARRHAVRDVFTDVVEYEAISMWVGPWLLWVRL